MSANIATYTDSEGNVKHSMYSLRKNPWHSLGKVVDLPLSDPGILTAAGLDWKADSVGLYRSDMTAVTTHKAIIRSDDKRQLGIVGKGYQPLQNDALLAFFRNVAGVADFTVETAGALGDGETVWALARIPGMILSAGDDISQGYMLIRNAHNGTAPASICPTMIRVVCSNTLRMACGEQRRRQKVHGKNTLSGGYTVRHTSGMMEALEDIADAYARTRADFATTQAAFSALTGRPLTSAAFDAMMQAAFGRPVGQSDESKRAAAIAKNRSDRVQAILASATCNVSGTAGTLWAGFNAITEYIDHERTTRGGDSDNIAEQRLASACFDGSGDDAKARAWSAALSFA